MKKILALLLAMILVFSLAACGADKKDDDDKDDEKIEDKEKDEKDEDDDKKSEDEDEDEDEYAGSDEACWICGEEEESLNLIELEDSDDLVPVCDGCYEDHLRETVDSVCYWCEEEFDMDELIFHGDRFWCEDCYDSYVGDDDDNDEYVYSCDACGSGEPEYVMEADDGHEYMVCGACYNYLMEYDEDAEIYDCDMCGDKMSFDDACIVAEANGSLYLCRDCYEDYFD